MRESDILTPQVIEAIQIHARNEFPRECAGVVVAIEGEPVYVRLLNVHPHPMRATRYRKVDLMAYLPQPTTLAFAHSHPHTEEHPALNCPSAQDMNAQIRVGKPFVICSATYEGAMMPFAWGDQLDIEMGDGAVPLVGRRFHHGIRDCYESIRCVEKLRSGDWIPSVPRDWGWWEKPGVNLYQDLYSSAGYAPFDPYDTPLEYGDVALMRVGGKKVLAWNHAGSYVGRGLILHHPSDLHQPWSPQKRSRRDSIEEWSPFIRQWVRRKIAA